MAAKYVEIPINIFKGQSWLLLSSVLGRRVDIMAHRIDKVRKVEDFDSHTVDGTTAKDSVKCKAKSIDIHDKILEK